MSDERLHVVVLEAQLNGPAAAVSDWAIKHDAECLIKRWDHDKYIIEVRNVACKALAALLLQQPGVSAVRFRKHYNSDWVSNER